MHDSFILRPKIYLILQLGNGNMPEVEMFAHVLQYFWLYPNLRVLESHDLLKHCSGKLGLNLDRNCTFKFDQVLKHLVEISC
jgi:hypothetical protein